MATAPAILKRHIPVANPTKDLTHLEISVRHEDGGINYANYKTERKGIYVGFQPMAREMGVHFMTERFAGFSGMKMLLEETTRMNRKKVAAHAAAVFAKADALAALWFARDYEGIRNTLGALPAVREA